MDRGPRRIVHSLDLELRHGEVLAILGPNGVGKSTLLRACAGLLPFDGSIEVDGIPLAELDARSRARRLAFVPQKSALMSALPVREVVAQGRYAHRASFGRLGSEDREAIELAVHTADLVALLDRPFTALSFGEQRRVLLARGLATGAKLLLLDEPTASLDIGHALALYELLCKLRAEGFAIAIVLHQLEEALANADRGILLQEGRVVQQGPVADVITPTSVRAVYGVELEIGGGLRYHPLT